MRFCSHRDMIRLFSRAMARAGIPVRFSEGFNPHPKFSLMPPRPVGVATEEDRMIVDLTEPLEPAILLQRLLETMPQGIMIRQAWKLDSSKGCQPHLVYYVVDVRQADREALPSRITQLTGSGSIFVQRINKKDGKPKRVDIAPYIDSLIVTDAGLAMTFMVTGDGTARPAEVCASLGLTDDAVTARTRRVKVEWK